MIDKMACFALEKTINAALALDPNSQQRLSPLNDKVVALEVEDWKITLYMRFQSHGVQLLSDKPSQVDTHMGGALFGLMRVGLAKGDSQAVFAEKINIEGDTDVAEKARDLLTHLDIDWEDHLSRIIGDRLAHHIGRGAKHFLGALKQMCQATRQSASEYLQYEANLLPCREEVNDFYSAVTTCRNDADRLEARIALLQGQSQ